MNGAAISCARANAMVIMPSAATPSPISARRRPKTGMMMPKPVISSATLPAAKSTMARARRGSSGGE